MDIIDTRRLERRDRLGTVKLVPLLTDRMAAMLFLTAAGTATPRRSNDRSDEIHVVLKGSGRAVVGRRSRRVAAGNLLLVPRGSSWSYAAARSGLALLTIGLVKHCPDKRTGRRSRGRRRPARPDPADAGCRAAGA